MSNTRIAGGLEGEFEAVSKPVEIGSSLYNSKYKQSHDYCQFIASVAGPVFGACEIQGYRKTQEDRLSFSVDAVKEFDKHSIEDLKVIFLETFRTLQKHYGDDVNVGSTACVATAWVDSENVLRVLTANLGDSSAYVAILDKDNQVINFQRLNVMHKPSDLSEQERIVHSGGYVRKGRMNSDLALTRAFGDKRFESNGISHTPEVSLFNMPLSAGEHAMIVVACDGMDNIAQKLGLTIGYHGVDGVKDPASLANALVAKAFKAGSSDNISVAIFSASHIPASAAVFDGHGGSIVAENVSDNFYPTLRRITTKMQNEEWVAKAKERIFNEQQRAARAIQQSRQKKQDNLLLIKTKFESCLKDMKLPDGLRVFIRFLQVTHPEYTAQKEYVLVFESDQSVGHVKDIEVLARVHHQDLFYFGSYSSQRDYHKNQYIVSFTENDQIPASFDEFMADVKLYLSGKKMTTQQPSFAAPGSPGMFPAPGEEFREFDDRSNDVNYNVQRLL